SRLGSTDLPKTKRAVARISVTDSGLIVVQVNSEGEEQEANFDVFSRDGEWLGSLHWDVPFVSQFAPIFSRCRVYGIVLDEMDVTYLVVGKIEELCDD
ncbi:MAG: hypothetical protein OEY63_09045, partial [Gemmatimonadota bacterium]|nr:hypothetical protein [Gemmatimonadota bacterium]